MLVSAQLCEAALLPASQFFPVELAPTYPTTPPDQEYWVNGATVICNYETGKWFAITFAVASDTATVTHETPSGSATTTVAIGSSAVEVVFEGFVFWFGTSASEAYTATAGPLIAFGFGGGDRITGSDGNDFIYGGEGGDVLDGQDGHDTIYGGPGDDRIEGGNGDDWLHLGDGGSQTGKGNVGSDTIWGGPGQVRVVSAATTSMVTTETIASQGTMALTTAAAATTHSTVTTGTMSSGVRAEVTQSMAATARIISTAAWAEIRLTVAPAMTC